MNKIVILFLCCLFLVSCSSQRGIELRLKNDKKLEPGNCYFSVIIEKKNSSAKKENGFVLEIEDEEFNKVEKIYSLEELKQFEHGNDTYTVPIKPYTYKYIFKNDLLNEFVRISNPTGFVLCVIEVPGGFKTVFKKDIINNEVKISFQELIKNATITKRYVRKKPNQLSQNQLFFPEGNWLELRKAVSLHTGHQTVIIRDVQRKLRDFGYDLKVDNILDEKTKAALLDFQKKNGLKTGQLDIKTLEALGVKY